MHHKKREQYCIAAHTCRPSVGRLFLLFVRFAETKVVSRLQEEGWEGAGDPTDTANVTYRHFLALLWGIKGQKMAKRSIGRRIWDAIVAR